MDNAPNMNAFCLTSEAPGSPSITSTADDIQASSMTVRWIPPADDGGSPITAYRVVILQGITEERNENVTDPTARSKEIGELMINSSYIVMVFARNYLFEGNASQKIINTKYEGQYFCEQVWRYTLLGAMLWPVYNYVISHRNNP